VQGCPLGTLLFALSFAPAYQQAKAEVDPNGEMQLQLLAYADDLYAIAPHGPTLTAFYNALTTHCATIGLELNSSKSGWLQPQHTNISTEDLNATLDIGARHNIMWVGGAPVRHPLASHKELHDAIAVRLHSMMHEVGSIANFTDPQHAAHALRHCGMWSRARHILTLLLATGNVNDSWTASTTKRLEAHDLCTFICAVCSAHMPNSSTHMRGSRRHSLPLTEASVSRRSQ
jgi:hypothetical protein